MFLYLQYYHPFIIFIKLVKYISYERMGDVYLFEESRPEMMKPSYMPVQGSSEEDEGKTQKEQLTFTGEQNSDRVNFLDNRPKNYEGSRSKRRRSWVSIMNLPYNFRNHIRLYLLIGPFIEDIVSVSRTWTKEEPHTPADVSFNLIKDCPRKLKSPNYR